MLELKDRISGFEFLLFVTKKKQLPVRKLLLQENIIVISLFLH